MKIIIVPIDNRPCVMQFPKKLAEMAGFSVSIPPEELLGRFTEPGRPEEILQWLKKTASKDSVLLISADMMIYGGLIASRSANQDGSKITQRTESLKEFLSSKPCRKAALFSVIMRTFPTFLNSTDIAISGSFKKAIESLFPQKKLTDREFADRLAIENSRAGLEGILPKYLELRKRNSSINEAVCRWKKQGIIDMLAIGLDDVVCMGPNIHEAQKIEQMLNGEKDASVCRGTDELPMTMIAYLASKETGISPTFSIEYSSKKGSEAKTIYEQKTVREVIEESVRAAGFEIKDNDGDIKIFCNAPAFRQKETELQHISLPSSKKKFIKALSDEIKKGGYAALADLAYANGSEIAVRNELLKHADPVLISAYAGWNTSGNTAGTAVAHAALKYISEKTGQFNPAKHAEFIMERILDDCEYESSLRASLKLKRLAKGLSVLNMSELDRAETAMSISLKLREKAEKIFSSFFKGRHKMSSGKTIDIRSASFLFDLPWPRLFEIKAEAEFIAEEL